MSKFTIGFLLGDEPMLTIDGPYFLLNLPDGWGEHSDNAKREDLHLVESSLQRELAINVVGLLACESEERLLADLQKEAKRQQLLLMRQDRAVSGKLHHETAEGELRAHFVAKGDRGVVFYHMRVNIRPKEGSHVLLSLCLRDDSGKATLRSLEEDADELLTALRLRFPL